MTDITKIIPDNVLDTLVQSIVNNAPEHRISFLASLGSRIHASATRVLFKDLEVPDDAAVFDNDASTERGARFGHPTNALRNNLSRYGPSVRRLTVTPGDYDLASCASEATLLDDVFSPPLPPPSSRPMDTSMLTYLLTACVNLEELIWDSPCLPPDGLGEALSLRLKLVAFQVKPSQNLVLHVRAAKWDAPSLPLLSTLAVTTLHLARLSQAGARALQELFTAQGEESTLETVSLDFVWLDDALCEGLVSAGRRVRQLRLTTSGTKLTDKGMVAICEGCVKLEDLALIDVEGRLSRSLWTKPDTFPPLLNALTIAFSESHSHHSWTMDHLQSLYSLPKNTLQHLTIERLPSPPRLMDGVIALDGGLADRGSDVQPLPVDFLESMREARSLRTLRCAWWSWQPDDLKRLLDGCSNLETISICLNTPFAKLLALSLSSSVLTNLRILSVCVLPEHAPGKAPTPLPPHQMHDTAQAAPPTPQESPVMRGKTALPQLLDFDQMTNQTCVSKLDDLDPSLPPPREVKRFVRKCPRLVAIDWQGKGGRGTWSVKRPTTSKLGTNVTVDYHPPRLSQEQWDEMMRQSTPSGAAIGGPSLEIEDSFPERIGQGWSGELADQFADERTKVADRLAPQQRHGGSRARKGSGAYSPQQPFSTPSLALAVGAKGYHLDAHWDGKDDELLLPISPPASASSASSFGLQTSPNSPSLASTLSPRSLDGSMNWPSPKMSSPRRARAPSNPMPKSPSSGPRIGGPVEKERSTPMTRRLSEASASVGGGTANYGSKTRTRSVNGKAPSLSVGNHDSQAGSKATTNGKKTKDAKIGRPGRGSTAQDGRKPARSPRL